VKVLHVTPLGDAIGGVEFVAKRVCKELLALGHQCEVIKASDFINADLSELKSFDVIHLHNVHSVSTLQALMKAFKTGKRVVVTPHYHRRASSPLNEIPFYLLKLVWKRALRRAIVHSVSPYEAQLLSEDFGVDPIVIPHGVGPPPALDKERYLVYAGRLLKYKRVDEVLKLAEELWALGELESVIVIGEGPDKKRLQRLASRLRVRAIFYPFLPHKEYLKTIGAAKFAANLSVLEAFSVFSAEALSSGAVTAVRVPWGTTFERCPNAVLVGKESLYLVAREMARRISQPCKFPGWKDVVKEYLEELYV